MKGSKKGGAVMGAEMGSGDAAPVASSAARVCDTPSSAIKIWQKTMVSRRKRTLLAMLGSSVGNWRRTWEEIKEGKVRSRSPRLVVPGKYHSDASPCCPLRRYSPLEGRAPFGCVFGVRGKCSDAWRTLPPAPGEGRR